MIPIVQIIRTNEADIDVPLPGYETDGAAGADIRANLSTADRATGVVLRPAERVLVPTGLKMAIPAGFEVQVRPRSGLALKNGISLVNAPGTIDSDYRGPVGIIMINHGQEDFLISHGERIAQLVVVPVSQGMFQAVATLSETERGTSGFGSTGRS